jgi:epoxyqueuosine reductase
MANSKKKIGSGDAARFDQRNTIYNRTTWDPAMEENGQKWYGARVFEDRSGYTLEDWAFAMAAWNLERRFGHGSLAGNSGLTQWDMAEEEVRKLSRLASGQKYNVSDRAQMSKDVKRVARFLGACLVGICRTDQRWVYSHRFNRLTSEYEAVDIPPEYESAIVYAVEMDYQVIALSPAYTSIAAAALGYSGMVYVSGLLAHFIRTLGYKAIPCGNDTALSIPMAIEAGLGTLGRHGMLITEKFGPRVRLGKVFTDLPLVPDEPIESGTTRFCWTCRRCAENCPAQAISFGEPTTEGPSISNNNGIYKWYINPEKCFEFWARNRGGGCANCVRVCPFNKPPGWLHDTCRIMVRNTPWLDPLLLRLDKFFGYGKRARAEQFWGRG